MLERQDSSPRAGRRRRHRSAIGVAGAVAFVGALVAPAGAQQVITPPSAAYQPVTVHAHEWDENHQWGERTEDAGDQNDDGTVDVWMGVPSYDRNDHPNYGKLFLMDGRFLVDPQGNKDKGKPIAEISHPEQQDRKQFGFWIENPGDLNGDGDPELVVGTDAQDVPWDPTQNSQICNSQPQICNQNQGKAWVIDGKTHNILYPLNNPKPQGSAGHRARFGSRIGTAGDVNGNGINDIVVGASGNDNPEGWRPTNGGDGCSDDGVIEPGCRAGQGQAFVFEGANGALIRELNIPLEDQVPPTTCSTRCGSLGLAVQGIGDIDGDGVPDQQVAASSYGANGRIYVFSGATGNVIRRIDPPEPVTIFFGFQDASHLDPGDVNHDTVPDIYGSDFFSAGETGEGQGKAWVFSGAGTPAPGTSPVLYEVANPTRRVGQAFGWSMTRDRNRDQPTDPLGFDPGGTTNPMLIGNAPHHTANCNQQGELNTFDASTGLPLQNFQLPSPWVSEQGRQCQPDLGPNLGWTVTSPGDLNHDGFREFIGGAPFTNVCQKLNPNQNVINPDQGMIVVYRSSPSGNTTPVYSHNSPTNACPYATP